MRITVRSDQCCGAGLCALTAPEVFDQGEDGLVVLLDPSPPTALHDVAWEAVRLCPTDTLSAE
ncbi:ferredoxin [Streptomyces sp. NPDC051976]|uniref:ferredoxin n=1 Tax=Streptomyces sp. NPDC051976 TaxID=3154947 RepID=UPI003432AEBC